MNSFSSLFTVLFSSSSSTSSATAAAVKVGLEQSSYTTHEGAGSVQICAVIIMHGFPMSPQFSLLVSTQDGSAREEHNVQYDILMLTARVDQRDHMCCILHIWALVLYCSIAS